MAMGRAISEWAKGSPSELNSGEVDDLAKQLQRSYTIYGQLLLLPSRAISLSIFQLCGEGSQERLWQLVEKHLKITHVALTQPIPTYDERDHQETNVIRAPSNLQSLYGDFGPASCASPPTTKDFESAFWVSAKQNGITQVWAPRWTMFSRGNITEKTRILSLPAVAQAVADGRTTGHGCAAVDLYAGIGYFTFSYLKAGVNKLLCWDINAWSIEGLRLGAEANKWQSVSYRNDDLLAQMAGSDAKLLIFNESNEHAARRVEVMRVWLPPVRHVNCGLLPSSQKAWETALAVLSPDMGGWIHIHENFDQRELQHRAEEVRQAFQHLLAKAARPGPISKPDERVVQLESVNRVKAYAPNVYHYVVDLYIPPHDPS